VKLVFIAFNVALHDDLMQAMKELGLEGYTRWKEVSGVGRQSGPHMGDHIWPTKNSALVVAADDEKAGRLLDAVRDMRLTMGKQGIKAFLLNVEDATE